MKLDRYELKSDDPLTTFEFLSEGRHGKIAKIIQFTLVNENDLYNLAFGDKNPLTGAKLMIGLLLTTEILKKYLQL